MTPIVLSLSETKYIGGGSLSTFSSFELKESRHILSYFRTNTNYSINRNRNPFQRPIRHHPIKSDPSKKKNDIFSNIFHRFKLQTAFQKANDKFIKFISIYPIVFALNLSRPSVYTRSSGFKEDNILRFLLFSLRLRLKIFYKSLSRGRNRSSQNR